METHAKGSYTSTKGNIETTKYTKTKKENESKNESEREYENSNTSKNKIKGKSKRNSNKEISRIEEVPAAATPAAFEKFQQK